MVARVSHHRGWSNLLRYLLSWASANGQLKVVRFLHKVRVGLSARNDEPLCWACDGGHLDILRYLHQNGGELTARDNEPLCRAAAAGHVELVSYIHQNGGDISARENEPLRRAAAGKHASVVRYLHEAGAATQSLTADARHSIDQMKHEMQAAPAVDHPSAFWKVMGEINERILGWSGERNFKRTLNQNYFNFIPTEFDEPRMVRLRRLVPDFTQNMLDRYAIDDPDRDPSSWMSFYPNYYIFKDPDGAKKRELYREYLALMYEYALRRDRSGLLAALDEPTLGNPIGVRRSGRLISQDLVNSVRERNAIMSAIEASTDTHFMLGDLGAGYGRLGYVLLKTTKCRYFVFDIPPALYLSQWYLTTLFPKRRAFRFRRIDTFKEIESELSQSELAFFTPNQLTKFPDGYFDLFANISSIHEMRHDQIKHYMELMGRTTKTALYLKQQKNYVNPVDNLVIGRNDYPLPSGWFPTQERFDLINPGFFERIYQRGRPTDVCARRPDENHADPPALNALAAAGRRRDEASPSASARVGRPSDPPAVRCADQHNPVSPRGFWMSSEKYKQLANSEPYSNRLTPWDVFLNSLVAVMFFVTFIVGLGLMVGAFLVHRAARQIKAWLRGEQPPP
jgi:putative sugar O-methyltransferase